MRPPQVELIRLQHIAFLGDMEQRALHHQLISQSEVVAVRIHSLRIKGIDDDFFPHMSHNFFAG